MRVDKQTSYFNTYLYNHSNKMKCKRVWKKNANIDNTSMYYQRGNRRTRRKPLHHPPSSNRSTRQLVGIHGLARDPLSLIYPLYLSPPISYSNKASRNYVLSKSLDPATSSMLHLPSLASSNAFQQHQKHSLHWKGVDCVWVQISSQGMIIGEGRRRGYNDFSLRMSSSLSQKDGYVL